MTNEKTKKQVNVTFNFTTKEDRDIFEKLNSLKDEILAFTSSQSKKSVSNGEIIKRLFSEAMTLKSVTENVKYSFIDKRVKMNMIIDEYNLQNDTHYDSASFTLEIAPTLKVTTRGSQLEDLYQSALKRAEGLAPQENVLQ